MIENTQTASDPSQDVRSGRNLTQILILLIVLLVLVNVPLNARGFGLAQLKPDDTALVIQEGMLLQAQGTDQIYLLQNHKLRRISSPEAHRRFFNNRYVHLVEAEVLAQFGEGQPIHRLVRCKSSPTVYALANGQKLRVEGLPIADSPTTWDRVEPVSCTYLDRLLEGAPLAEQE